MTIIDTPKVSVCIPTYNYGHFLSQAIESVLSQTLKDFELIIVDNCSSDNTKNIAKYYCSVDHRLKYYCNETNVGLVRNFNRCIEYAKGEYVKILCADNVLEPTCLEKSVDVFRRYTNVEIVSVARLYTDEKLKVKKILTFSNKFELIDGLVVINKCLLSGNLIGENDAVLFRKKSAGSGFNLRYNQIADLEMWFRLLEIGAFAHIPEALCKVRQHKNQDTNVNIKSLAFADEEYMLLEEYFKKYYVSLSFLKKQRAKYRKAELIWSLCSQYSYIATLSKISQHYNLALFFFLFAIKKLSKF